MDDLDSMNEDSLEEMERRLQAELNKVVEAKARIKAQDRSKDLEIIQSLVSKHGFTFADVASMFPDAGVTDTKRGRTKASSVYDDHGNPRALVRRSETPKRPVPVKYIGPNGEAWSGRGLDPKWLVASGKPKAEFLIKSDYAVDLDEVLAATAVKS